MLSFELAPRVLTSLFACNQICFPSSHELDAGSDASDALGELASEVGGRRQMPPPNCLPGSPRLPDSPAGGDRGASLFLCLVVDVHNLLQVSFD